MTHRSPGAPATNYFSPVGVGGSRFWGARACPWGSIGVDVDNPNAFSPLRSFADRQSYDESQPAAQNRPAFIRKMMLPPLVDSDRPPWRTIHDHAIAGTWEDHDRNALRIGIVFNDRIGIEFRIFPLRRPVSGWI
jgi:hypothetical protein